MRGAPSRAGRVARPRVGSRWGELAAIAADSSVVPSLRRAAERQLSERIEHLSRGERVSLARRATRAVLLAIVARERDPAVVRAALCNPRMTEPDVLRVALDPRTRGPVLDAIGTSLGWCEHPSVRLALARNARTPSRTALRAVVGLPRRAMLALAEDPAAPRLVRMLARRTIDIEAPRLDVPDRE